MGASAGLLLLCGLLTAAVLWMRRRSRRGDAAAGEAKGADGAGGADEELLGKGSAGGAGLVRVGLVVLGVPWISSG